MVEEYVYIGRRRHWARTLIYGILTLGIYGRVLLYRQVKEIDGHRALFIDVRLVGFLLVLPIFGPLAVKLRLRRLLVDTVTRDITHSPVRRGILLLLAFIPIVPAFQIHIQHHLNIYWRRQTKIEDVKHLRSDLEKLRKRRKTDDVKRRIQETEDRIERLQSALHDEEEAARAIQEAEAERRAAERELKRVRRGPIRRLMSGMGTAAQRARPNKTDKAEPEEADEASSQKTEKGETAGGMMGRLRTWRAKRSERKEEKRKAKETAKEAKAKEKQAKEDAKTKENESSGS